MALRGSQEDHPTAGRDAPEAEDAQPSLPDGNCKPERERFGDARRAGYGAAPLPGPALPPAARAAQIENKKSPHVRRAIPIPISKNSLFPHADASTTHRASTHRTSLKHEKRHRGRRAAQLAFVPFPGQGQAVATGASPARRAPELTCSA